MLLVLIKPVFQSNLLIGSPGSQHLLLMLPFFKKRHTSLDKARWCFALPLCYSSFLGKKWDSNPREFYRSNLLSYPGETGRGIEPLTRRVWLTWPIATIAYRWLLRLHCRACETLTWFVIQQVHISLAVKQAFVLILLQH